MQQGLILIIDDDADYVPLIQLALRQAGVSNPVQALDSGRAALKYLRDYWSEEEPLRPGLSLIILDLNLPGMSGLEALRSIRSDRHFSDVPIVVFTGTRADSQAKIAMQLGADDFWVKPFGYDALVDMIRQRLRERLSSHQGTPEHQLAHS